MRYLFIASLLSFWLSGCVVHSTAPAKSGPPAHAEAHGYKHKHGSTDLTFDSGLGVYVVVGHPGYYFWHDHYWWFHDGYWRKTAQWGGAYVVVNEFSKVPPGLAKKHGYEKDKHKSKGKKDKGKGKNKD